MGLLLTSQSEDKPFSFNLFYSTLIPFYYIIFYYIISYFVLFYSLRFSEQELQKLHAFETKKVL